MGAADSHQMLSLTVQTDKKSYQEGDTIQIEWVLKNNGSLPVQILLPNVYPAKNLLKFQSSTDDSLIVSETVDYEEYRQTFHTIPSGGEHREIIRGVLKKRSIVFNDCALSIGDLKKITVSGEYAMNERFPEFLEPAKKDPSTHYDSKVSIWTGHFESKPVTIVTVLRGQ